ncbi:MAG TPA: serine hydrolase domain-containing protein [Melioribacteraceae bacterium]|nr:serine hydrolase domain-containing protein [Melioribacteraceae bacterium]
MKKILFILLVAISVKGQIKFTDSEMDSLIFPLVKDTTFSGCILIGNPDTILFKKAYGYANYELEIPNKTNYVFNMASISKQFTGASILVLSLQNKLSIEDTLKKYLPDFPNADKITIKQLLTHKSGIQTYNDFKNYDSLKLFETDLPSVVKWIQKSAVFNEPNDKFLYSNSNYGILAYIVEKVSGIKFNDFLSKYFFNPAKMNQTGNFARTELVKGRVNHYEVTNSGLKNIPYFNYSFKYGSGALQTSVEDLYKWYKALNENKIYDSTFMEKFLSGDKIEGGYGYGLGKNRIGFSRIAEHEGGVPGVSAFVVYVLEPSYFIVFVSNVTNTKTRASRKEIFNYIYQKLGL